MGEYQAVLAYMGVTFIVFIGGLIWNKFREAIKRRLGLENYKHAHSPR